MLCVAGLQFNYLTALLNSEGRPTGTLLLFAPRLCALSRGGFRVALTLSLVNNPEIKRSAITIRGGSITIGYVDPHLPVQKLGRGRHIEHSQGVRFSDNISFAIETNPTRASTVGSSGGLVEADHTIAKVPVGATHQLGYHGTLHPLICE